MNTRNIIVDILTSANVGLYVGLLSFITLYALQIIPQYKSGMIFLAVCSGWLGGFLYKAIVTCLSSNKSES